MEAARAKSVLCALLLLLPRGWWWPLIQASPDHGIATVFGRPRLEIAALLVNAGMVKENKHGFTLRKTSWEGFRNLELGELSHGTIRKAHFVATLPPHGEPCKHKNAVCTERVELPPPLLDALGESEKYYNSQIDEANRAQANA